MENSDKKDNQPIKPDGKVLVKVINPLREKYGVSGRRGQTVRIPEKIAEKAKKAGDVVKL